MDRIVVIGSHKVTPSTSSCHLNILLQAAMDIMDKQGVSLARHPPSIATGELFTGG
jgi:hypothetical protein